MRTISGRFLSMGGMKETTGMTYAYLYVGEREVAPGDFALVHNGSAFGMIKVERVKPGIEDKVTKHVLAVVTQGDYDLYMEANKQIHEYRKVFDELDYELKEHKRLEKYEDLARVNPKVADLLKKAKEWHGPVLDVEAITLPTKQEVKMEVVEPDEGPRVTREDIERARPADADKAG